MSSVCASRHAFIARWRIGFDIARWQYLTSASFTGREEMISGGGEGRGEVRFSNLTEFYYRS